VLERLGSVPWEELDVAGVSDEVLPDLLRTMAGPDDEAAIDAFHDVSWEILHQGTVYSATAPTVPFLVELAGVVGPVLRGAILDLLGDLAHRHDLGPDDELSGAVRDAVTAEVDRLLPFLEDPDPYVRYVAAYAVSGCPARRDDVLAALTERWRDEPEPRVRAGVVMGAAMLDRRTDLVRDGLGARQPNVVRAASVLAAVRSGRRWPGARAVAAVRDGWRDGDPFAGDDDRWRAPDWYPEAMADLLDNLAPADQPSILEALLRSGDPAVRVRAATRAAGAIGARRSLRLSLPALLVPLLDDDDPAVRLAAAHAIRRAGRAAAPLVETLADLARGDDAAAGQAVAALVELGDARAADLVPGHLRRGTAAGDLGVALAGAAVTPGLLAAVRHRIAALAEGAGETYVVVRAHYREFQVSELVSLLGLVTAWGPDAVDAAQELVSVVRSRRAVVDAAAALAAIGPGAAHVLPDLPTFTPGFLEDGNNEHRVALARARWRLSGDPGPAADEAWLHVARGGAAVRGMALLKEIGEPAHVLIPRIRRSRDYWLANEGQRGDSVAVARLLWEWTGDPGEALPAARGVLADLGDDMVGYDHVEAAILAVDLGEPDAVATLLDMLGTGGRPFDQVMTAYRAIWLRTGDAGPFLAYLSGRLADDEPPSSYNWPPILALLTELGPAAAPLHPALHAFAEQDEQVVTYLAGDTPGIVDERVRANLLVATMVPRAKQL
jgi:hypothetical protein